MSNVIIIHGAYGYPGENWIPWLKTELEKLNHKVSVPKFPTPEGQNLDNWMKVLNHYDNKIDSNTILVGHSIGCAFIIRKIEKLNKPIKAAFLIAGFMEKLGNNEVDEINSTFYDGIVDWDAIRNKCKNFFLYNSDNDPYVPLEVGERVAEHLGTKITLVKGAGHFNKKAGYLAFPRLLEDIKTVLSKS